jgi:type III secretion system low calcium response chaperone LcrH/SycD
VASDSEDLSRLYVRGYAAYGAGRPDEAAEAFAALTALEPADPRLWFARAAAAQQCERFEEAVAAYAFAALLDPDDPWALVHLGECLLRLDARETARGAFERAIARGGPGSDAAVRANAWLRRVEATGAD